VFIIEEYHAEDGHMRGLLETILQLVEFTILEDKTSNNMALHALCICTITKVGKGRGDISGEETFYD
jgi:hypothetical protein